MPVCRATSDTEEPGCMVCSTKRTFSAVPQRRRRWTEVITSTWAVGASGSEAIVMSIGQCLCPIELRYLSGPKV